MVHSGRRRLNDEAYLDWRAAESNLARELPLKFVIGAAASASAILAISAASPVASCRRLLFSLLYLNGGRVNKQYPRASNGCGGHIVVVMLRLLSLSSCKQNKLSASRLRSTGTRSCLSGLLYSVALCCLPPPACRLLPPPLPPPPPPQPPSPPQPLLLLKPQRLGLA